MTLRAQIVLTISLVFVILVLGLAALGISNSRQYVEQQLASHAQDAASALSLPVSQALAAQDRVMAEALIASVFDRGYYQQIVVFSPDGARIIKRELPREVSGVPVWFSDLFDLDTAPGEAFLNAGWRQLGKIVVVSQPAFAYQQAWSSLSGMVVWATLIFAMVGFLLAFLLRLVFRPLDRMAQAAHAIVNRRFEPITPVPRARELFGVVSALNLMIASVKRFLDEEEARSESFRREAYFDAITGLQNRRAFDLMMRQRLGGPDREQDGALLMISLEGLKEFNIRLGYPEGNRLLREIAVLVQETAGQRAESVSRIGGATFAVVLFDCNEAEVESLAGRLRDRVFKLLSDGGVELTLALGCSLFSAGESMAAVMSRTDLALEMAINERHGAIALNRPDDGELDTLGSQGWRQLIRMALKEQRWVLHAQPLVNLATGDIVHREIMARLLDREGHLVPAGRFLPMAARHGLMPEIDLALIQLVLARKGQGQDARCAINISRQAIESKSFVYDDLVRQLASVDCRNLSFEMSEYSFVRNIGAARALFDSLRNAGCKVGIDRFGIDVSSMYLLRTYPPDYIKLDGGLVEEISEHADSAELVRMIVHLAESLNVEVYAQGVEKQEIAQLLQSFGVRAGQGYYYGPPALF